MAEMDVHAGVDLHALDAAATAEIEHRAAFGKEAEIGAERELRATAGGPDRVGLVVGADADLAVEEHRAERRADAAVERGVDDRPVVEGVAGLDLEAADEPAATEIVANLNTGRPW